MRKGGKNAQDVAILHSRRFRGRRGGVPSRERRRKACSLVLWNTNGQAVVVARTWDLYVDDKPRLVYLPRGIARRGVAEANAAQWTSKYASTVMTGFDAGASDGMNEAGLSAHLLYLHGAEHDPPTSARPLEPPVGAVCPRQLCQGGGGAGRVQRRTDRVKQAHGREWPLHLAIEDASGDSAVLEYVGGKVVVHHGKDVNVMTNEPTLDVQLTNLKRYKLFGGSLSMPVTSTRQAASSGPRPT